MERLGCVRVTTAYEFFCAVKDNLDFIEHAHMNRSKPPFEATNYMLFYYASDEKDAEGKEFCTAVLDRSEMWDCSAVKGSSTCYEFAGRAETSIETRHLPCPCEYCSSHSDDMECTNAHVVGNKTLHAMTLVEYDDSEYIKMPLDNHTIRDLMHFIRSHKIPLPRDKKKANLIACIADNLAEFITAEDAIN